MHAQQRPPLSTPSLPCPLPPHTVTRCNMTAILESRLIITITICTVEMAISRAAGKRALSRVERNLQRWTPVAQLIYLLYLVPAFSRLTNPPTHHLGTHRTVNHLGQHYTRGSGRHVYKHSSCLTLFEVFYFLTRKRHKDQDCRNQIRPGL